MVNNLCTETINNTKEGYLMLYLDSFVFYIFSSSIILVYGIGLERVLLDSRSDNPFNTNMSMIFFQIISSVFVLWYPINYFLLYTGFQELSPLFIILGCGIIEELTHIIFSQKREANMGENLFYFGIVFLSLAEGVTLLFSLIIASSAIIGFIIITTLLFSIKNKVLDAPVPVDLRGLPLALISMGLLSLIIHAADASWWFSEVIK